jgi:hypothetical protein
MKIKKIAYLAIIALVVMSMCIGCGSAKSSGMAVKSDLHSSASITNGVNQESSNQAADDEKSDGLKQTQTVKQDSKIIKNGSMDIETTDFSKSVDSLIKKAENCGGYVESSNISGLSINDNGTYNNRNASIKLRIPEQYFAQFMVDAGSIGNVLRSSTNSENVTYQYFDNEAHITALKTEEARLLELLKKTGDLKDIISVENELTNVRYQIENLTGTLKKLDNLVSYSTITVDINEVQNLKTVSKGNKNLWNEISKGFINSIKLLVRILRTILIATAYIIPFAAIGAGIYFLIKRTRKK